MDPTKHKFSVWTKLSEDFSLMNPNIYHKMAFDLEFDHKNKDVL